MKKDPRVYLAHILECAQRIERYTKGGEKEFLNESLIQDAVIRNFEVIGEAVESSRWLGRLGCRDSSLPVTWLATTMYRKNDHLRANAKTDAYALMAWCWQVLAKGNKNPPKVEYDPGTVTLDFLRLTP